MILVACHPRMKSSAATCGTPRARSLADQLAKLAVLRDHGVIRPTDFEHEKTRMLA